MIFQVELTNLDSELGELQALLSAKQQQRNLYNQLQQQTEGYLVGLAKLKNQIAETVGGGAIASLKSALMNLFDPGDHGGKQPIDPTPDNDPTPGADLQDDSFDIIALNGETGDCLTTDDLDDIDDAGTTKLTYAQAIKRRCSACWGYGVTSKGDIKSGFANRTNLGFMEVVNLERSGKEFYETVEAYLDRLYYTGQAREFASVPEFDKPLVAGDRFWHGAIWSTGTVIQRLGDVEYEVQIDGAIGTVMLDRPQLHYILTSLEGQTSDIDAAPLTGQACDWASPFAFHLASALWEDAPFIGQHCTITPSATENNQDKGTSEGEPMPYVQFVEVTDRVGYVKVVHSGEIKATYAGFTRKDRAEAWGRLLAMTYNIASGFEVRPAKHLPFKWELKLWDMKLTQIQKLASEDLTKSPRVEVNSAKPPAREPVILDSDRVVVGQRIKTKDGQNLEISSTLSTDNRFFAKDASEQRQLIELDDVAEFLPTESPAQTAEIAVGSSIRVLNWQHHDCNQSSDIATVLEIEDGMYRIDVKNSQGINIWLSRKAITPLSAEADQTPAQQLGIEPPAGWRQVQPQTESSPTTTPTKKARITLESSPWKGQDCEVLEVTPDGHWWKLRLPNGQELKYPSDTIEPVVEATETIEFNDLVEVVADSNDCVGLVGSFGRVKVVGDSRIGVEIDEQLVYLKPSELRIKAKEEKAPQRQSLQPGQVLMGDRIITTGKYIGERRVSQLLSAKLGTADKIAAIQLAKDLKNLGFDPQLAVTVMAGGEVDDASDF